MKATFALLRGQRTHFSLRRLRITPSIHWLLGSARRNLASRALPTAIVLSVVWWDAQNVPVLTTGPALARSTREFDGSIEVRALHGGRVLVNLSMQRQLVVLDSTLNAVAVLADTVPGVAVRYARSALALIPYSSDSTLFLDVNSRAFILIDPNGRIARSVAPLISQDMIRTAARTDGGVPAVDGTNAIVYEIAPHATTAGPGVSAAVPDSTVLVRVSIATAALDTIARLRAVTTPTMPFARRAVDPPHRSVNPMVATIDGWAVLSTGAVAIVRGGDYHIDILYPDGSRISTPRLPFAWRRLSDADKQAKIDSARRIVDSLRLAGSDPYMLVIRNPATLRADTIHPVLDYPKPDQLADYIPPIRANAVFPDADGNLWILPTTTASATEGLVYDMVNSRGELYRRVKVPKGAAVVGFGPGGTVYLRARTPSGRWSLERTSLLLRSRSP